jgi:ABC-2 type transport system permease protein
MKSMFSAGSIPWLFMHEVRVTWRSMELSPATCWGGVALMLVYFGIGVYLALSIEGTIETSPYFAVMIFIAAATAFTFNISGSMRSAQHTLYEQGDLELLFTSPISPARVIMAKLAGISISMVFWNALFLFPLIIPIAAINNPQLFGILAVVMAVSVLATSFGLGLTLLIVYFVGPRAARRYIQIIAAFIGAAIFVVSQLAPHLGSDDQGRFQSLYLWCLSRGVGIGGISGLPGRAAFGDPLALIIMIGAAVSLFWFTAWSLQTQFLRVYQSAANKHVAKSARSVDIRKSFGNHPGFMIIRKEFLLLRREPSLIYNILLQLIFMMPLLVGFGQATNLLLLMPGAAFMSVFAAAKLVGDITGLAISSEDAPDLLKVSPLPAPWITRWKLYGVMLISVPLTLVIPLLMFAKSPAAAVLTLVLTVLAGGLAAAIELKYSKPRTRHKFRRRGSGSVVAYVLGLVMSVVLGGAAAYAVSLLSP